MDTSVLLAKVHLSLIVAHRLKLGDDATVTVPGMGEPVPAKFSLISPALDPGSTTIEVWLRVDNHRSCRSSPIGSRRTVLQPQYLKLCGWPPHLFLYSGLPVGVPGSDRKRCAHDPYENCRRVFRPNLGIGSPSLLCLRRLSQHISLQPGIGWKRVKLAFIFDVNFYGEISDYESASGAVVRTAARRFRLFAENKTEALAMGTSPELRILPT
jgi:hypothetical protein